MALKIILKIQRPRYAICTRWGYVFWGKAGDERKHNTVWDDGSNARNSGHCKVFSRHKRENEIQKKPKNERKTPQFTKEQVKQKKGKKETKKQNVVRIGGQMKWGEKFTKKWHQPKRK